MSIDSPSITILVGLPASGKSTYVKKYLESYPDVIIASSDDVIQEYADANGMNYTEAWNAYKDDADKIFKENLQNAIDEKKTVIVDRTNLTAKARRRLLANVPKTYNKYAVVFSVPDEELNIRLVRRAEETGKHIPAYALENMRDIYEPPSEEEGFTSIHIMLPKDNHDI